MTLKGIAPTRIDLAGGTLDIWPLYLFMEEGLTVNAGITINSEVTLTTREDSQVTLRSKDSGDFLSAESLDSLPLGSPLDLFVRALKFYHPSTGLEVLSYSSAPRGSGLGASSSLLISFSHLLNHLKGYPYTPEQIIDFSANIEAQCIGIPTGKQDYYPPTYGGVNAIWFRVGGNTLEPLGDERTFQMIEQTTILSFTGISHFSGTNNWRMMKRYIEKRGNTVECLNRIKETAYKMREALLNLDFSKYAQLVAEEWENRKQLAKGVTNARIDRIMNSALSAGALANKLCGAGGGGCMITIAPPERRLQVEIALQKAGARVLKMEIARRGVQIQ